MTRRLTGYDHAHRSRASIQSLMLLARRNLDPFTRLKNEMVVFNFQRQFTLQNEEELARMDV